MTTGVWITFASTASWKNSANGEWAGKGSKRGTTFPSSTHNKCQNSCHACTAFYLEPKGSGLCMKKVNWNGSSRRRENRATWCILSEMSFSQWPLGYASQRRPVKVMLADARWSVSLTLSNHDNIYGSKCCTFTCYSDINLTWLHIAGNSWHTNSFHPWITSGSQRFLCIIPSHSYRNTGS